MARLAEALSEPAARLDGRIRIVWVRSLADEDRRFFPGALHFVAPAVVCVDDRHRTGRGAGESASVGVWLADEPLVLGAMACEATPEGSSDRVDPLDHVQRAEPLATDVLNSAANAWRGALTLTTSQFLVALLPASTAS